MKKVKVEKGETVVTLELTETELKTIVSYFGTAGVNDVKELARKKNFKILNSDDTSVLYSEFLGLANSL